MNTTFTNYAEKKAKQFFNLLQGYTKGIRLTAILILLLMGVNNAWAYVTYYLKSNNTTWSTSTYDWGFTHGTTTTTYMDNNGEFKLWRTDWGDHGWFGKGNNTTIDLKENDHNGVQLQQWLDGGNVKYIGPSGMVCFHMDQDDGKEASPWVWITRPTFYLKHNWGGGSWTWKALKDNEDGTYTLTAKYGGTGANYGDDNTSQDGWGYIEDKTPDGNPTTSHNCEFKFNSKDKSLTITRLYTITYNGNGHTGGTVPAAIDKKHGTNITLSSSTPTRTGYTFAGWNTKQNGTGTTYAKGATYSTNADVTLYAKWTANTYTVKFHENGGKGEMEDQGFTYGNAQTLTENAFTLENALFVGWATSEENANNGVVAYTNGQSVSNLTTTKDGVVNLYAVWATIEITACPERIKLNDQLTLTISYKNIPENYIYRVYITNHNQPVPNNNGEWITISGSGTLTHTSRSGHNFTVGENNIVVELYNQNHTILLLKSEAKTFIAEQIGTIAVYTRKEGEGDVFYTNLQNVSASFGVSITAPTIDGYRFDHWEEISGGIVFTPNTYSSTVTVTASNGGQIRAYYKKLEPKTIYLKTVEGTTDGVKWYVKYNDTEYLMDELGCTGEYYRGEVLEQTEFQFISKNNEQEVVKTINITAIPDDNRNMYVLGQKMYLKPEGAWNQSEYRFAACFRGYGPDIWVDMTDADTDGIYECIMPNEERTSVWFCIMDKNQPDNNWTNKIQQRVELPLPDNGNNYYTITADNINDWASGGTWSTHEDGANGSGEWEEFDGVTYRITLDNRGATTMGTESMDIKVGDSMLDVTLPEKTGHDFGGYFTQENGQGDMLINASGEWQNIDGYVADGEWVKEDCATLYAKWIQKRYVIAGTGSGDMGNWLNGFSWINSNVTILEDNVININEPKIYSDCSAGIKNFRIVRWGSDDQEHGIDQLDRENSSNIPFYTNEHNNISFVTIAKADITIEFDGTNITVNVEYDQDDLANVKNSIVTGENVMFYFGDELTERTRQYLYVNELENSTDNHVVTETKGFLLEGVGAQKWLAVAILDPNKTYNISNDANWGGVSTGEDVQAGAIYAWYGNQVMGKTPGVTPILKSNLRVQVGHAPLALATCEQSSIKRDQTIEYYYKNGGNWEPFELNDVSTWEVGTYEVHALAHDGNIYVRSEQSATLEVTEDAQTTTVYFKPIDGSTKPFKIKYDEVDIEMSIVDCDGQYYTAEIPNLVENFTFQDKDENDNITSTLTTPTNDKVLYDMTSTNITKLYLNPNHWTAAGAWFAAYFYNDAIKKDEWVKMTDNDGDGTYECSIPTTEPYPNVIFVRMNKDNENLTWDAKWNQTKDLEIPNNGKNNATIKTDQWDGADVDWSTIYDDSKWTTAPTYNVKINIVGEGAITIGGNNYNSDATISNITLGDILEIGAITSVERWRFSNATTKCGDQEAEELTANSEINIYGSTTITVTFEQTLFSVNFDLNLPQGVTSPGIASQLVSKNDKATEPQVADADEHLFAGWYTDAACTPGKEYDFNTPVTKDITLYAKWIPYGDCIFYKNNLNWDEVYVYFYSSDKYWTDDKGTGANMNSDFPINSDHRPHYRKFRGKMTRIGLTDIWYFDYISAAKRIDPTNWEQIKDHTDNADNDINYSNIAFTAHEQDDHSFFDNTKVIRRGDFKPDMQLFIPQTDQTPTYLNKHDGKSTRYYNSGLWMKYNSTVSGYDWSSNVNDWNTTTNTFTAEKAGGYSFTTEVKLTAGTTYQFKIHNLNGTWFGNGGTMTQNRCTNWQFWENNDSNAKITPTITGNYVFTIYLGDGEVRVSLDYPLSVGDYRLVYKDNTHGAHDGHYIKKRTDIAEQRDTVSFFIHNHKDENPQILLQYCSAISNDGEPTWITRTPYNYNSLGDAVTTTAVYNFILKQTNSGNTHTPSVVTEETHKYTGNFYIRTDAAAGGWKTFRQEGNRMTYSSFAEKNTNPNFNHYFCEWITANRNVKFTIANDYSYCISDTLDGDNIINKNGVSPGCLPADANVRFGWDSRDNSISRAYIAGSGHKKDRFLVIEGNEYLKDIDGNAYTGNTGEGQERYNLKDHEVVLEDMGNWIYQMDVTANSKTEYKLTALYNNIVQYFKGTRETTERMLATDNQNQDTSFEIRLIYDFKTNHIVAAWLADDTPGELGADMMVIRKNQDDATQIAFNGDKLTNVQKAYAVMTFTKGFVNGSEPIHARKHYWVSFPFDVNINEVFGFSEYMDHWILQLYDGQKRADEGWWYESGTFWKYITNRNYTLKKGVGYVLTLDLSKMGANSSVFKNTDEVSLYFPSTGLIHTISGEETTNTTVDSHECTIERENRYIYDSHWNIIGVPGFADISTYSTSTPIINEDPNHGGGPSFYYEYLPASNSYQATTTENTFKTMYGYMVQYTGTLSWTTTIAVPNNIAARRNSESELPEKISFRLEIAQDDVMADQTFVQLQQEGATAEFDMNLDLTKIINSGANIYTLAGEQRIQSAGNALPMGEAIVPVGVQIATEGEYTFRMPDGTEGMVVELIDYETNTRTNLLLSDYIVTLPKGTHENRFALHIQPEKDVTTGVGNVGDEAKGIEKYLINGKLIIRTAEGIFDAQGHRL